MSDTTIDGKTMFPGRELFKLKDTHGLPLDAAITRIAAQGLAVDWPGFIEAAREHGWWDFQTEEALFPALDDAEVFAEYREAVKLRFKAYVLKNRHPAM